LIAGAAWATALVETIIAAAAKNFPYIFFSFTGRRLAARFFDADPFARFPAPFREPREPFDIQSATEDPEESDASDWRRQMAVEAITAAAAAPAPDWAGDLALARRIAAGDTEAARLITTRHNQLLFRTAWSILRDRDEAEEVVQSAYLRAFDAIGDFAGRASLATWLTRIVLNEALGRVRSAKRRRARLDAGSVVDLDHYRERLMQGSQNPAPDASVAREQIRRLIEQAIAALPESFRLVFVLREVEELSVEETADALGLLPATVKTRHLRARRRLQEALAPELKAAISGTFPFAGADCLAITERVVAAFAAKQAERK
jgi:RNA polymerase sigma-70 factor (ECF subfamily)